MRFERVRPEEVQFWSSIWRAGAKVDYPCVRDSEVIYLVKLDDNEEPILACGIYREIALQRDGFLWITVGRNFHPLHWIGVKKLLAMLRRIDKHLFAIIDDTDPKNGALARAAGMTAMEGPINARLYRWV